MALSFAFNAQDPSDYEAMLDRQKAMEALLKRGRSPQTFGEGIYDAAQSIASALIAKKGLAQAKEGRTSARGQFANLMDPQGGQSDKSVSGSSFEGSQEDFVKMMMPLALESSKQTGVDPRIIVAQAALETGWGKSAPGSNYFGIKSHGQPNGLNLPTTEIEDGQAVQRRADFRQYDSPEQSTQGYTDFLKNNPRYQELMNAEGLDNQISALQASGYATDPNYGQKVSQIANSLPQQQTNSLIRDPRVWDFLANPYGNDAQQSIIMEKLKAELEAARPRTAKEKLEIRLLKSRVRKAEATSPQTDQEKLELQRLQQQIEAGRVTADQTALTNPLDIQQRQQQLDAGQTTANQAALMNPLAVQQRQQQLDAGQTTANQAALMNPLEQRLKEAQVRKAELGSEFRILTPEEVSQMGLPPGAYQIGADGKIAPVSEGGVTVNTLPTIPRGYRGVYTPDGKLERVEPIPGGPAELEEQAATIKARADLAELEAEQEKLGSRTQTETRKGGIITQEIDRVIAALDDPNVIPETGLIGGIASQFPGTSAYQISKRLETIRANIGFQELQQMREASPTGGALGQVSNFEVGQLQSLMGNLTQSQGDQELRDNLNRVYNLTLDIIHGADAGPERRELSFENNNDPLGIRD